MISKQTFASAALGGAALLLLAGCSTSSTSHVAAGAVNPLSPADVRDEEHLRDLISYVHQIGWQLRLGEHIEGKAQAERERAVPPANPSELGWLALTSLDDEMVVKIRASFLAGKAGEALPNRAYSFISDPEADPFRNVGRAGYEAENRELQRVAREIGLEPFAE
jgi:hypothetical protein